MSNNNIQFLIDTAVELVKQEYDKKNENAAALDSLLGSILQEMSIPDDTLISVDALPLTSLIDLSMDVVDEDNTILEKMRYAADKIEEEDRKLNYLKKVAHHENRLLLFSNLLKRINSMDYQISLRGVDLAKAESAARYGEVKSWGFQVLHSPQNGIQLFIF